VIEKETIQECYLGYLLKPQLLGEVKEDEVLKGI
jgi:hypothetical protein